MIGEIELDGTTSENDLYSFQAEAGDLLTIEVFSRSLRSRIDNTIDSLVRLFDASGNIVDYYGSPLGAFNDDGFEPTDSILVNVPITASGTYYAEVDTFNFFTDEFPSYVPDFDPVAFCDGRNGDVRCDDTDTGQYELFIYRLDDVAQQPSEGDFIIGGPGVDTIVSSSGFDSVLVDGDDVFDGPGAPEVLITNQAPVLAVIPTQIVNPGDTLTFTACLLYTSPSPRDQRGSRMPSSA